MPPWVLDSTLTHATKRQLQFMYDIGVLAPFMLDVACVAQLEKLDEGEAQYALDELGKALADRVRLRNPSGFFIRICQRLRATRREREGAGAPGGGGPAAGVGADGGPVSFAEREQARERERERERARLGGGDAKPRGAAAEGGFGAPGPAGGSPRGGFGPPGPRPGRGRGGPDELEPLGEAPPSFRRRGRSGSRSPPPRQVLWVDHVSWVVSSIVCSMLWFLQGWRFELYGAIMLSKYEQLQATCLSRCVNVYFCLTGWHCFCLVLLLDLLLSTGVVVQTGLAAFGALQVSCRLLRVARNTSHTE